MADSKQYSDLKVYGNITAESIEIFGHYSLPSVDGTNGQIISTNGSGVITFVDPDSLGLIVKSNFIPGIGTTWQSVGANIKVNVSLSPFSTTNLTEGSNLYFTNERVDDRVNDLIRNGTGISWIYSDGGNSLTPTISLAPFDTDSLSEGAANLYYNNEYVDDRVSVLLRSGLVGIDATNPIVWTYVDGLGQLVPTISLAPFDTDALSEGASNLYYDDELVDDRVATLITNSATITWVYDDILGTLTASSAAGITGIGTYYDGAYIGIQPALNFTTGKHMEWQISEDSFNNRINVGLNALVSIEAADDTQITAPIAGEHLVFDGVRWINSSSGVAPEVLEDLDDVFFGSPGPQDGDHLIYEGGLWVAEPSESNRMTEVTSTPYIIIDSDRYISHQYSKIGTSAIYLPLLTSDNHGIEITIKDASYSAASNNIAIYPGGVLDKVDDNGAGILISTDGGYYSFKANFNTNNWEAY